MKPGGCNQLCERCKWKRWSDPLNTQRVGHAIDSQYSTDGDTIDSQGIVGDVIFIWYSMNRRCCPILNNSLASGSAGRIYLILKDLEGQSIQRPSPLMSSLAVILIQNTWVLRQARSYKSSIVMVYSTINSNDSLKSPPDWCLSF